MESMSSSCLHFLLVYQAFFFFFIIPFDFQTAAAAAAGPRPLPPRFPNEALPTKSGYLSVNSSSGSSIYYAFYEAQRPVSSLPRTPLLVWLQGGPGCSSMIGNFFELGPWFVSTAADQKQQTLTPNPSSWNRLFGLLFLDNPIGTGFSTAGTTDEIPRDQTAVATHLWIALQFFLSSNPSFRSRPLYLTGESYAGKYVPAAAYYILQQNSRTGGGGGNPHRIELRGVAIGNGLTHPVAQVATHASSAYFSGLINERQRLHLEGLQDEAVRLTLAGDRWAEAADARNKVLEWLQNATGLATLYDQRRASPYETGTIGAFLNDAGVQAALGVDKKKVAAWEDCSDVVGRILHPDVMKSVKPAVEGLLVGGRGVRVLLYQGLFDLRDGVVSTEAWIKELQWEGLEGFLGAERKVWKRVVAAGGQQQLAGYVQRHGRLSQVVVAGAGHLVPADQGPSSQSMIEDWVLEEGPFGSDGGGGGGGDLLHQQTSNPRRSC